MESLPVALKVQLEVELEGRPLRIMVQVEGEGEPARLAAAEVSAAIASALSKAAQSPGVMAQSPGMPAQSPVIPGPVPQDVTDSGQIGAGLAPASLEGVTSASSSSTASVWIQRNRARMSLGFGALLLVLAMLVPVVVPAEARHDMLIITILFGLTAALLLFTALLPARGQQGDAGPAELRPGPTPMNRPNPARALPLATPSPLKAGWGMLVGVGFVLAGLLAPFALGANTADERFIIMLGFAPVCLIGVLLIAIFGRSGMRTERVSTSTPSRGVRPATDRTTGAAVTRAPVARVPNTFEYRGVIPLAIVTLLVVMVAVLAVVILATVAAMR
jgi:hypothetical protein